MEYKKTPREDINHKTKIDPNCCFLEDYQYEDVDLEDMKIKKRVKKHKK